MFEPARIDCCDDARRLSRRRLPSMVFDYVDGAAGDGSGDNSNQAAIRSMQLVPKVLRNTLDRSIAHAIFGRQTGAPFGIAPMGFGNLVAPGADEMMARFAARHAIPIGVSTASTTKLEVMAEAAMGNAWFQLYYASDGAVIDNLLARAKAAQYDVLVFTVDVPEVGRRPRELRHDFQLPFRPNLSQVIDCALHPRWSFRQLAAPTPTLANFGNGNPDFDRKASRAGADFDFVSRLRDRWQGKLVVKGVLDPEDARRLFDIGVDAVQVSSHGGRQLQSAIHPFTALRTIRDSVGTDAVMTYDSGIRSGEDVAKAIMRGADFVFLGRPFLFAIGAKGEGGLEELWTALTKELTITMAMLGVSSIDELAIRDNETGNKTVRHAQA